MRVFVTHNTEDLQAYFGRALAELTALSGITEVRTNPLQRELTTAELIDYAHDCDVIIAYRSTPGEAAVFAELDQLVAFLRCAIDISTIDVDAASEHGVLVGQADKSFVASTAELALGLYLDTARNIASSTVDYRNGAEPVQRPGSQIAGKTAGIIGFGAIGSYLASLLSSLGLTVVVHDPFVDVPEPFEQLALDPLLEQSDVVFILAPDTPATHHFISIHELATLKAGATLINVSGGSLLDEDATAAVLDSGHLAALGLDVGQAADGRPSLHLARRPNVVATPHLGGLTPENSDAQASSSVEQVESLLRGLTPPRSVNAKQAFRLHKFLAQLAPDGDTK